MKKLLLIISLSIFAAETYSQKVYLTREGLQKLTRRLEQCEIVEMRLNKATREITDLRRTLTEKELEFLEERTKLDLIIAKGEEDYIELEKKYENAIKLIPKRKRK